MKNWDYATDIRASLQTRPPRAATRVILIVFVALAAGITWASQAELEEVTRGEGRVVPSSQIQIVQAPEKGIVKSLLVKEGQIVQKGDVVVRVDDTGFSSQLGELQQRQWSLLARAERLMAEASGVPLELSGELTTNAPGHTFEEEQVYLARNLQLTSEISLLKNQRLQREQELEELLAEKRKTVVTMETLAREVEINERLFKRKVLPEIEFLRLKRQLDEAQGSLEVLNASIRRVTSAGQEAEERIANAKTVFHAKARQELAAARAELAVINETIKAARDKVQRTDLEAPVYGVVNQLNISTIGAVVQPGEPLVEIVPLEDTLLIEAQISPQDVAFLRPGQEVTVKITAYDYSIYGGLKGKLERIAADSTKDEQGNRFFKVNVRTDKNYLGTETDPLPIIPGMVASIDVLTGFKTVLDYILKPINKVRSEALRER
ncbi:MULTISPECIES: HlyD family type I secretion periplasmic adaptor subunit [unclassified Pseudovibrio]|uniref:HlyD family type I secretion periplasmic adaptor subunit n=1 Tax=unclassified Pseudovibrio TaxID=2627060 RepID=UPI0007AE89E3|nr:MULTISPECIES: HlyD family type I secretion periplasmic adaptor subunit [unclassified Pseudovibrio]KZK95137.1 Type I secretion system membrane fusion protein PrsE [Pseudovibrio sp. W74]KZL07781.1 Type I secretion system membrane fusion protein PrsE [Pseudovibrio sp. Ad14]